jgi:hypothetical protein
MRLFDFIFGSRQSESCLKNVDEMVERYRWFLVENIPQEQK